MVKPLRPLLPWIGLLAILLVSSLTSDVRGEGPIRRNQVLARLDQTRSYGQTFVLEHADLTAMRVLMFPPPGMHDDPVVLRVHYPTEDVPDLAYSVMPVDQLSSAGMTTFAFEPLRLQPAPNGSTPTLQMTIETPTLPVEHGITLIGGSDTYPDGQLFINGTPFPESDLAFQPVYRVRWFDRVLPISRMAAGKPALFGWPPFYALLAYGYIYLLIRVLVRFWRSMR